MKNQIGIIGVGLMGHGIAANIQRSGMQLAFLKHPGNQPVDDLIEAGASEFLTARELAAVSDVVIICVTGSKEVEDVLCSDTGVLRGLRAGATIIDCSTSLPGSTRKLAAQVDAMSGHFLDAPMTRTPKEASEGRLNLIVGGEQAVFEEQLPLLNTFAENITHAGPVGAGHTMKLIHNFVSLGFSAVLAEAAACSGQAGIGAQVLVEVLAKGGGGGVILDRLAPYILSEDDESFRFSLSNAGKDTGYYLSMVEDLNGSNAAAAAIHELYRKQVDGGRGEAYVPHLVKLLAGGQDIDND